MPVNCLSVTGRTPQSQEPIIYRSLHECSVGFRAHWRPNNNVPTLRHPVSGVINLLAIEYQLVDVPNSWQSCLFSSIFGARKLVERHEVVINNSPGPKARATKTLYVLCFASRTTQDLTRTDCAFPVITLN